MSAFGHLIAQARLAQGISARELGRRAGLDHTSVTRLEAGRRRASIDAATAAKLLLVLGVPPRALPAYLQALADDADPEVAVAAA